MPVVVTTMMRDGRLILQRRKGEGQIEGDCEEEVQAWR
jgi:hypothetical protein